MRDQHLHCMLLWASLYFLLLQILMVSCLQALHNSIMLQLASRPNLSAKEREFFTSLAGPTLQFAQEPTKSLIAENLTLNECHMILRSRVDPSKFPDGFHKRIRLRFTDHATLSPLLVEVHYFEHLQRCRCAWPWNLGAFAMLLSSFFLSRFVTLSLWFRAIQVKARPTKTVGRPCPWSSSSTLGRFFAFMGLWMSDIRLITKKWSAHIKAQNK